LTQRLFRDWAIKRWFIFPSHLNSVSALPCKTDKHKFGIFLLNVTIILLKTLKTVCAQTVYLSFYSII